jgi:hypothetical protein
MNNLVKWSVIFNYLAKTLQVTPQLPLNSSPGAISNWPRFGTLNAKPQQLSASIAKPFLE